MKNRIWMLIGLTLLSTVPAGAGENVVQSFEWDAVFDKKNLRDGVEIRHADDGSGDACLHLTVQTSGETKFGLLTIGLPMPTTTLYAVTGEIRYRNVQGDAYLEMWNEFPDGS